MGLSSIECGLTSLCCVLILPSLIEVMNCEQLRITNLTLRNSPFWTIHPVYCDDVVVADVNIFAPLDSPNTDGIDPDSCSNVLIERCYVESGDDGIAIKSGWDCFGQAVNRPTVNITIRDFTRKGIKAAGEEMLDADYDMIKFVGQVMCITCQNQAFSLVLVQRPTPIT